MDIYGESGGTNSVGLMIMHFLSPDFFKKPTKLELLSIILSIVFGGLLVGLLLYLKDKSEVLRHLFSINEQDAVDLILLLSASLILGLTFIISTVYRRYIRSLPRCSGCSNKLEKYIIDVMKESLKCRICGFESSFYQFPDKIFLHYKLLDMMKIKDLDPVVGEKIQAVVAKFENFEFNKKRLRE